MLEILRDQNQKPLQKLPKYNDEVTVKWQEKVTYEKGKKIIELIPIKTNITKKITETAKLIKENKATETLAQLEAILQKEANK